MPALVAVELGGGPNTASTIEHLVTANLDKIKDSQLSRQSDKQTFQNSHFFPIAPKSDCKNMNDSPYDSLESDQRSFNPHVHIEDSAKINEPRMAPSPVAAQPLDDADIQNGNGGTTHHHHSFLTDPRTGYNNPSLLLTLSELNQTLSRLSNAHLTNTNFDCNNRLITNRKLTTVDNTHGNEKVNESHEFCYSLTKSDSLDDDILGCGLIPGEGEGLRG